MHHTKTVWAAVLLSVAAVTAGGCRGHAPESKISSVEARIEGITCPTCVPPLQASLTRQYAGSKIAIDDDKDTATITFAKDEHFSLADLRTAVERVRMRVVTVRLQACGQVDAAEGGKWLTAGGSRLLVRSDGELPLNQPLCVDGTLDPAADPATLQISTFSVQGS